MKTQRLHFHQGQMVSGWSQPAVTHMNQASLFMYIFVKKNYIIGKPRQAEPTLVKDSRLYPSQAKPISTFCSLAKPSQVLHTLTKSTEAYPSPDHPCQVEPSQTNHNKSKPNKVETNLPNQSLAKSRQV